jgi:hypothetical protein
MLCRNVRVVAWLFAAAPALMFMAQPAQAEIEFGIPEPLPFPINDESGNVHSWLTSDDLTIYVASSRPGGALADIWVSTRASTADPWDDPLQNLGSPISSPAFELGPSLTEDQLEIYFYRTFDPLGLTGSALYTSQRDSLASPWSEPAEIVFTPEADYYKPIISPDGLELTFASTRETDQSPLGGNIYVARRTSREESFGAPEFVDVGPGFGVVSPDSLTFALFGGPETADYLNIPFVGTNDIFLRMRESADDDFGAAVNPLGPLNSSFLDEPHQFSSDGSILYFTSDRPGVPTGGFLGQFGVWQAPIAEAVSVDIKPGSDVAPINLKSKGKLPVAILSTDDFSALDIDVETLVFGDPVLIADGGDLVTPTSPLRSGQEDVNNDGLVDLTLKFSTQALIDNGVLGPLTTQGYLTGTLLDGTLIAGRDMVRIVPGLKSIPEPSSLLLVFAGMLVLTIRRRA